MLSLHANVPCVWVGAGLYARGHYDEYSNALTALMSRHGNLYISLTPELIAGKLVVPGEFALELACTHPERVLIGTTPSYGRFSTPPPEEFGDMSYREQVETLRAFVSRVAEDPRGGRLAAECVVSSVAPNKLSSTYHLHTSPLPPLLSLHSLLITSTLSPLSMCVPVVSACLP